MATTPTTAEDTTQPDAPVAPAPGAAGLQKFFYKNGQFSKTATFASIGNFVVLVTYALQSWLAGAIIDLHITQLTVPQFNVESALAIFGVLNGTYLTNNAIKAKTPPAP